MKTNKIDVIITLTEAGLKLIQKTDTLKYLFHVNQFESLKIGENKLTVNHFTPTWLPTFHNTTIYEIDLLKKSIELKSTKLTETSNKQY